jgi:two-component system cell cycle response regulator DivK
MNHKPVVLYVEDDPSSRKVMEFVLKFRMNLSRIIMFEESSNFQDRVQALNPRPDVIFLDIHMRPHSGFEMLATLRELEQYKDTPVVALTASVMNDEVATIRAAGFDGCFAKPLNVEMFESSLAHILSGKEVWEIT